MQTAVAVVFLLVACASAVPLLPIRHSQPVALQNETLSVQIPRIVDRCNGECPFVPVSAAFDVDPVPGGTVIISFKGLFKKDYPSDGHFECRTYVRVIFWIEAGYSEGLSCVPGGFNCPIIADPVNEQTEAQTLEVPSNAIRGSYYSHCHFFTTGRAVYANAEVYFEIY